jgi:hypothetical protein
MFILSSVRGTKSEMPANDCTEHPRNQQFICGKLT